MARRIELYFPEAKDPSLAKAPCLIAGLDIEEQRQGHKLQLVHVLRVVEEIPGDIPREKRVQLDPRIVLYDPTMKRVLYEPRKWMFREGFDAKARAWLIENPEWPPELDRRGEGKVKKIPPFPPPVAHYHPGYGHHVQARPLGPAAPLPSWNDPPTVPTRGTTAAERAAMHELLTRGGKGAEYVRAFRGRGMTVEQIRLEGAALDVTHGDFAREP